MWENFHSMSFLRQDKRRWFFTDVTVEKFNVTEAHRTHKGGAQSHERSTLRRSNSASRDVWLGLGVSASKSIRTHWTLWNAKWCVVFLNVCSSMFRVWCCGVVLDSTSRRIFISAAWIERRSSSYCSSSFFSPLWVWIGCLQCVQLPSLLDLLPV